jgi:hypothetical protein
MEARHSHSSKIISFPSAQLPFLVSKISPWLDQEQLDAAMQPSTTRQEQSSTPQGDINFSETWFKIWSVGGSA